MIQWVSVGSIWYLLTFGLNALSLKLLGDLDEMNAGWKNKEE